MTRPLELSLFPELRPPRYIGPLVQSVIRGSNADLIAAVAPLYLTGSVLDVTFGRGGWWRIFQPEQFTSHDLAIDGVDFRALPELDHSIDAVCFDPPYISTPSNEPEQRHSRIRRTYSDLYGLTAGVTEPERFAMMRDGMIECARVARTFLLVKCCDAVMLGNRGQLTLGHVEVLQHAETLGLVVHDLIVHNTGPGPGGHNIETPRRTRRAHSYLVVLKQPTKRN